MGIYSGGVETARTPNDINELRSDGYSDRDVLDVVGLVALNVLTGTFNIVTGLEPEPRRRNINAQSH